MPVVASSTDAFRDAIPRRRDGLARARPPGVHAGARDHRRASRARRPRRGDGAGRRRATLRAGGTGTDSSPRSSAPSSRAFRAPRPASQERPALSERELVAAYPGEVARRGPRARSLPDLTTAPSGDATPPLGDDRLLVQRFASRHAGLTRVDVHTRSRTASRSTTSCTRSCGATTAARSCARELLPGSPPTAIGSRSISRRSTTRRGAPTRSSSAHSARDRGTRSFGLGSAAGEPYATGVVGGSAALALRTFAAWPSA